MFLFYFFVFFSYIFKKKIQKKKQKKTRKKERKKEKYKKTKKKKTNKKKEKKSMHLNEKDGTIYICFFAIFALIVSGISLFVWRNGIITFLLKLFAIALIILAIFFSQRQIRYLLDFESVQEQQQLAIDDLRHHLKMNLFGNYLFLIFLVVCVLFVLKTMF